MLDAPLPAPLHDAATLRGRAQAVDPPVLRVALPAHEAIGLERLNDPRHRRRPHLFGRGELAEGPRPAEDEDGERGELRRRHSRRRILAPDVPKRMNRRRVEAVGSID